MLRQRRLILEKEINDCEKCNLCRLPVNQVSKVFGNGNCLNPDFFLVGLAPSHSASEVRNGDKIDRLKPPRAFQHKIGFKFRELLREAGIYKQSYITNILKCSAPGNRTPKGFETKSCLFWLEREFKLLKPNVVIPLGRFANDVIWRKAKLTEGGAILWDRKVIIVSTFHPNYCYSYHKISLESYRSIFKELLEFSEIAK